jgi:hypothetical protein
VGHGFRGCRLTTPTGLGIITQGGASLTLGYDVKRLWRWENVVTAMPLELGVNRYPVNPDAGKCSRRIDLGWRWCLSY